MHDGLKKSIKNCERLREELRTIDAHEAAAQKTIDEILADGRVDGERELEKLSRAQTVLSIAKPHRARVEAELAKAEQEIASLLRSAVAAWNLQVRLAREAAERRICEVNAPFFGGDVKRARRRLLATGSGVHFDLLHELGRCHYSADQVPPAEDKTFWSSQAEAFLGRCRACARRFPELGEQAD